MSKVGQWLDQLEHTTSAMFEAQYTLHSFWSESRLRGDVNDYYRQQLKGDNLVQFENYLQEVEDNDLDYMEATELLSSYHSSNSLLPSPDQYRTRYTEEAQMIQRLSDEAFEDADTVQAGLATVGSGMAAVVTDPVQVGIGVLAMGLKIPPTMLQRALLAGTVSGATEAGIIATNQQFYEDAGVEVDPTLHIASAAVGGAGLSATGELLVKAGRGIIQAYSKTPTPPKSKLPARVGALTDLKKPTYLQDKKFKNITDRMGNIVRDHTGFKDLVQEGIGEAPRPYAQIEGLFNSTPAHPSLINFMSVFKATRNRISGDTVNQQVLDELERSANPNMIGQINHNGVETAKHLLDVAFETEGVSVTPKDTSRIRAMDDALERAQDYLAEVDPEFSRFKDKVTHLQSHSATKIRQLGFIEWNKLLDRTTDVEAFERNVATLVTSSLKEDDIANLAKISGGWTREAMRRIAVLDEVKIDTDLYLARAVLFAHLTDSFTPPPKLKKAFNVFRSLELDFKSKEGWLEYHQQVGTTDNFIEAFTHRVDYYARRTAIATVFGDIEKAKTSLYKYADTIVKSWANRMDNTADEYITLNNDDMDKVDTMFDNLINPVLVEAGGWDTITRATQHVTSGAFLSKSGGVAGAADATARAMTTNSMLQKTRPDPRNILEGVIQGVDRSIPRFAKEAVRRPTQFALRHLAPKYGEPAQESLKGVRASAEMFINALKLRSDYDPDELTNGMYLYAMFSREVYDLPTVATSSFFAPDIDTPTASRVIKTSENISALTHKLSLNSGITQLGRKGIVAVYHALLSLNSERSFKDLSFKDNDLYKMLEEAGMTEKLWNDVVKQSTSEGMDKVVKEVKGSRLLFRPTFKLFDYSTMMLNARKNGISSQDITKAFNILYGLQQFMEHKAVMQPTASSRASLNPTTKDRDVRYAYRFITKFMLPLVEYWKKHVEPNWRVQRRLDEKGVPSVWGKRISNLMPVAVYTMIAGYAIKQLRNAQSGEAPEDPTIYASGLGALELLVEGGGLGWASVIVQDAIHESTKSTEDIVTGLALGAGGQQFGKAIDTSGVLRGEFTWENVQEAVFDLTRTYIPSKDNVFIALGLYGIARAFGDNNARFQGVDEYMLQFFDPLEYERIMLNRHRRKQEERANGLIWGHPTAPLGENPFTND